MGLYIMYSIEFLVVWSELLMMNETEDGKLPDWKKLLPVMLIQYLLSLFCINSLKFMDFSIATMLHIPLQLIALFMCCHLFTGGVFKIWVSIFLTDIWCGLMEIIVSVVCCLAFGKELGNVYAFQYEGNILTQCIIMVGVVWIMMFFTKPLFAKYKNVSFLDGKWSIFLLAFYLGAISIFGIKPIGIFRKAIFPYYHNLIFMACAITVFIVLLGVSQKKMLHEKIQSLYLKQKMEQEYELIFEDMDKNIRCFRHDIKKHMEVLSYFEKNAKVDTYTNQLKEYQKDLKMMYEELTYGNYCGKKDVNMVLMQLENDCCNLYPTGSRTISVSLKNLNLDSIPVYIRVQLFEQISDWIKEQLKRWERWDRDENENKNESKNKISLLFSGESSAGFHTLKVVLQCSGKEIGGESHFDLNPNKRLDAKISGKEIGNGALRFRAIKDSADSVLKRKIKKIKEDTLDKNFVMKINKLLYGYKPSVKVDFLQAYGDKNAIICWHDNTL